MNKKIPVIDQIFRAIITSDSEAWNEIEAQHAEESVHVRALVCSNAAGGVDLDFGLGVTSNEYIVPIFEGPRASFLSRHTSVQAALAAAWAL